MGDRGIPPGFERVSRPGIEVLTRPEARAWVERSLRHGTLYIAGQRAEETLRLRGRGTVYAVPAQPGADHADGRGTAHRWVVRHYRRGGLFGPLLGDRYGRGGTPRPFDELRASEQARVAGIDTPRVVAAGVYRGPLSYRGDMVTEWIPGARNLAEVLFEGARADLSSAGDRRDALGAAGALIHRMGRAGVHHPDLNARNILLEWSGAQPRPYVLDLDRTVVYPGRNRCKSMHARLRRSLRKLQKGAGVRVSPAEWSVLANAALEGRRVV